jgi:hypothetical protein
MNIREKWRNGDMEIQNPMWTGVGPEMAENYFMQI